MARMNDIQALPLLDCLSSPVRLALYRQLLAAGPDGLTAGELARRCELTPSKASFHFRNMVAANLIQATGEGRHQRYRLCVGIMAQLIDFLTADCCGGQPELCGLVPLPATCCPSTT